MKVKYTKTNLKYPPLVIPRDILCAASDDNFVASTEYLSPNGTIAGYNLSVGEEYLVYGILVTEGQIRYLICDKDNEPAFFPAQLFSITNSMIMFDWEFNIYQWSDGECAVWGDSSFAKDYHYFVDLINKTPRAMQRFLDYKATIESYY